MDEYIDREALFAEFDRLGLGEHSIVEKVFSIGVRTIIAGMPAADVAPVAHGRWTHLGGDEWCCSACGFVISTEGSWEKPTKKYCEDCGAKMDGGDGDAAD